MRKGLPICFSVRKERMKRGKCTFEKRDTGHASRRATLQIKNEKDHFRIVVKETQTKEEPQKKSEASQTPKKGSGVGGGIGGGPDRNNAIFSGAKGAWHKPERPQKSQKSLRRLSPGAESG